MKHALIVLLISFSSIISVAQEHHVWADVGTAPGFSLTYNYNKAKRWSMGGGFQANKFHTFGFAAQHFIPSIYGNIRLNMRAEKKNQLFSFIDLGVNIYQPDNHYSRDVTSVYYKSRNNGFYTGLAFGYMRRMTKRNGGPYATLKLITDWSTLNKYSIISVDNDSKYFDMWGKFALNVGFKF